MNKITIYKVLGLFFLLSVGEVHASPSPKIAGFVHKILQSVRIPRIELVPSSSEDPFMMRVETGKLDIVGNMDLKVVLGACLTQKEWKEFEELFTEKFLKEHPNCALEIMGEKCVYTPVLIKSMCSFTNQMCKEQKYATVTIRLKCLLPMDEVDMFSKKERFYK